jgi:hypothetical protein
MKEKTTEVTVQNQRWQIRRMTPTTGSYIWQRLMAAMFKAQMEAGVTAETSATASVESTEPKPTPEQRLRGMCGIAFMHLSFADTEFMQVASMKVISRIESLAGVDTPMPAMDDAGRYAIDDVASDPFLVTRLTVEALVFSLAPFLVESGA